MMEIPDFEFRGQRARLRHCPSSSFGFGVDITGDLAEGREVSLKITTMGVISFVPKLPVLVHIAS
jgi:hypothetical protein